MSAYAQELPDIEHVSARQRLSNYIVGQATLTAMRLGFGWKAQETAPSQYGDLVEAFDRSKFTGEDLPVSSLFCTNVIYTSSSANHAMRYWHDAHHVLLKQDFSPPDELELAMWHCDQLLKAGFSRDSTEYKMLKIDTVGQNYLVTLTGSFPRNQARFVERCLTLGVDEGVLEETRAAD